MTAINIATGIIALLLLASRFINAAKPLWDRLPKPLPVLLPALVAILPSIGDLLGSVHSWADLTTQLIAAIGIIVVGLYPAPAPQVKP